MAETNILILGACGQVGTELTVRLREIYGNTHVITTDLKAAEGVFTEGAHEILDVMQKDAMLALVKKYRITQIYHLAALLSATAEKNPMFGWQLNMDSLLYVLNIAKDNNIQKVYWPSSIAVFGPTTPRKNTPQDTIMDPNTVYGISKLAGERWCEYFYQKFGVDTRSIRYPGLISYKTEPGGGTTDYAVHIFYEALRSGSYQCFLKADTPLPMLYMPDAIKATVDLMEAPAEKVKIRSSYNLGGFSFTPEELAASIKKHIPDFSITYQPDFRQAIADSWPGSIDDSRAKEDWGWKPDYNMEDMVKDMLDNVKLKIEGALV
jgi:nucleoside-diphosphate-sugar epimerase